jgi:hypothetical protein
MTNIANLNSMKVNQHRNLSSTATVSRLGAGQNPAAAAPTTDFTAATQLAKKLAATPEVRSDEVARAKALIADPNYPNTATIEKVARQIAKNISTRSSIE